MGGKGRPVVSRPRSEERWGQEWGALGAPRGPTAPVRQAGGCHTLNPWGDPDQFLLNLWNQVR